MTFDPRKDSIKIFPYVEKEFDDFFTASRGDDGVPDYDLATYSAGLNQENLERVTAYITEITNARAENFASMYWPMAKLLTLMSLDIDDSGREVLVFYPTPNTVLRVMDGGRDKPDLVAFFAPRDQAQKVIEEKEIDVPPVHKIVAVVEMKTIADPVTQCLRYLFAVSRYRPSSRRQYGIVTKKTHFQLLALNLEDQMKWKEVNWDNPATCINSLYSCVKLIRDEALRPLHEAMPVLINTRERGDAIFSFYAATVGGRRFRLLPIFSGRGNCRKPFIALAAAEGNPKDVRVFKYSWNPSYRRGKERTILKKIQNVPGVVQVDDALSNDSLDKDGQDGRERSLVALKTIAHPLCSCSSVREFLEVMYDLLEVLRYLVQEKKILHRDISWSNVLVNRDPTPIVVPTEPTKEPIKHKYRFISDIFNEKTSRIRVSLADFDYASDLSEGREGELRDATGTPMFMANDVLLPGPGTTRPVSDVYEELRQSALEDCEFKYYSAEEKAKWDEFYSGLEQITWKVNKDPEGTFKHGAVHDAESVFWLCVVFFNRMWRKRPPPGKRSDPRSEGIARGKTFRDLATKAIGMTSRIFARGVPSSGFDESFCDMLNTINNYLDISWKDVAIAQRGQPYEFHLHDFMQRLILRELRKMRNGDGIPIQEKPLRVFCIGLYGNSYTSSSRGTGKVLGKRSAAELENERSDQPIPTPRDGQDGFPRLFWDILREKNHERLWLVADKLVDNKVQSGSKNT